MKIFDALSGGLLGGIKDVIGAFKLDPAKKAELQAAIDENAHIIRAKELDIEAKVADQVAKEIEAASANIRAEASSGDRYTSRARPTFLYMMELILFINYVVFPLMSRPPLEFPEALFWLFGSCMLGYTGARTWEKVGVRK
jgi:hypothetical protein